MKAGSLFGISVGPGDPELITVKGLRQLQAAPVVAFPAGKGDQPGLAERIIQPWLHPQQQRLPLTFPYVQDPDVLTAAWETAAQTVWPILAAGQDVAFACEGDANFYGTFTYLAQTLQHLHPEANVTVVPGVCSPLAVAALLGEPLTIQHQRLLILPALYHVTELDAALQAAEVVVLMKVRSVYAQVWQRLQAMDLLTHSVVVAWATLPQQRIYRHLDQHPDLDLPYFSMLIVRSRPTTGSETSLT